MANPRNLGDIAPLVSKSGTTFTLTNNLNFGGTYQRITGDFSNATVANRLSFQSNTTNGNTGINILPNGTATTSGITVYSNSDPDNSAFGILQATSSTIILSSTKNGTGSLLPLSIQTGGTERLQITTSGAWGLSGANYGTSGQVLTSNGSGSAPTWQAPSGGSPAMTVVTATTQTAVANAHYVLTNAAASTVTLPASPAAGDIVWVTVGNDRTDNVIARNGQNIMSLAEDMTLNDKFASVQLRFINTTLGWRLL